MRAVSRHAPILIALLSATAAGAAGDAPVPGVAGSSSATLPMKPSKGAADERPSFYRGKKTPPRVPDAAAAADVRGLKAIGQGKCDEAIRAYDEALAVAPGTASFLFNRSQCLAQVGRLDEAIRDVDAAVKADPELGTVGNARFHYRIVRGGARLERGEPAGALEDFTVARTLDPRSAPAWSEEAVALAQLGRQTDCVAAASRALTLDPRRVEALGSRAACLARLGRRAEALEDLGAAISIAPRAEAYASRAFLHAEAGHSGPARRDAREAVRLDPRLEPILRKILGSTP